MYKIVALMGKAGSGKDTLLREIIKGNEKYFHEIISNTTRPPREGEIDGVNYHFLTNKEYEAKLYNNELLETSCFRDWYYGTSYDNLDENKINVGVYNPTGYISLLKNKNIKVLGIMIDCSDKERLIRQLTRENNPDVSEIIRRYSTDKVDFEKLYDDLNAIHPDAYQLAVNNDKGTDISILVKLISGNIKSWDNSIVNNDINSVDASAGQK